jgi:RNA polymerase sigma factor (sigma-70 family)
VAGNPLRILHRLRPFGSWPVRDSVPDAVMLDRFVRCRDEAAFAALVERHGPLVLGVARRLLGDAHAAEDVFQAVFLVLARKAGTLRRPEALAGWLHGVARRLSLKARAAAAARKACESRRPANPAATAADPLDELTARELLTILDEELGRLPEVYRLPLLLCCVEGRTQEEAARQLGCTPGSLKGRLERGRDRLHARLVRRGLTLSAALATLAASRVAAAPLPGLSAATSAAALAFAAGSKFPAGVSAPALALAKAGLRGLAATKGTAVLALVLAGGLLAAGTGTLARQTLVGQTPPMPSQAGPPAADGGRARPQPAEAAHTDLHGDPLPAGAVARLGAVRLRHGSAHRATFSRDGRTLVTSGHDGSVVLWDVRTGKWLRRVETIRWFGGGTAVAPDQTWVAVLPEAPAKSVVIWEFPSGRELRQIPLPGPPGYHKLAVSPDGKTLAVADTTPKAAGAGKNGEVTLWDPGTGKLRSKLVLEGMADLLTVVDFGPDGQTLVTKNPDGTVRLWDLATGRERGRFPSGYNIAPTYSFSPDGKVLAAGKDLEVSLWDLATGKQRRPFDAHPGVLIAVAFAPDGKTVASATHQSIHFWDVATGEERGLTTDLETAYRSLVFSPDSKVLASVCGADLRLWDAATGKEVLPRDGHEGMVHALAFSPDGATLVTAGGAGQPRVWDPATGRQRRVLGGQVRTVRSLAFAPDGKVVFGGDDGGTVHGWDPDGAEKLRFSASETDDKNQANIVFALALSPDGKTLTALDRYERWDEALQTRRAMVTLAWDLPAGKAVRRLEEPADTLGIWTLAPGGAVRVKCNTGPQVEVREAATGRSLGALDGKCQAVWPVAFCRDGNTLAGVCHHGVHRPANVVLWEVATGLEVRRFEVDGVDLEVACSPDGRLLAAGGREQAGLQVWDLATGRRLVRYRGYEAKVSSLAFSPDGRRLASGLDDGTALVWDVPPRDPEAAPKDLTAEELDRSWAHLAAGDGARGQAAVWSLAARPAQTVALLRVRLQPARPPDDNRLRRLIADLESDNFTMREAAAGELQGLGAEAEPALHTVLEKKPAPETRRRLEAILSAPRVLRAPEALRRWRAVQVLERTGAPEAVPLLEGLSRGAPAAAGTREAKEALERLGRQPR